MTEKRQVLFAIVAIYLQQKHSQHGEDTRIYTQDIT